VSDVLPFASTGARSAQPQIAAWPPLGRVLFRFGFTYLVLSASFWIFEFADKSTALIARPFHAVWRPITRWTAVHVFHWSNDVSLNFVRDTRYLYALLTCFAAFSVVTALVWSLLDRKRLQYSTLNHWLRVFLRYVLAYLMLHYGMDKVFLLQFPAPTLARLTERFGDFSPSSLMWAFIGSSVVYTIFGGLAEVLGGALLLFRNTTTLGALLSFAVMFNVAVMDFSYDVAVKLLCVNMLLMAVYLAMPDAKRLLNVFFLNRATQPAPLGPAIAKPSRRPLLVVLKVCVLLYLIVPLTLRDWKSYHETGAGAPKPPLYGLYSVDDFTLNGIDHPPLITDSSRWRYVIFETPNTLTLRHMDDSLTDYRIAYDPASHTLGFETPGDTKKANALKVTEQGAELQLDGTLDGQAVSAKLKRVDRSSFTLVSRGFRWISETSFIH
jgi:uncharacterized membrane protein YphA (DoxX/SURF4 family)